MPTHLAHFAHLALAPLLILAGVACAPAQPLAVPVPADTCADSPPLDAPVRRTPALGVAADGSVVLAVAFVGALDLGAGPMDAGPAGAVAVARFDRQGKLGRADVVLRLDEGTDATYGPVAVAADGSATLVGVFAGAVTLTGAGISTPDLGDVLVVRVDPKGAIVWSRRFGGRPPRSAAPALAVAAVADGGAVVSFLGSGAADLGAGPVDGDGLGIFVARLGPDGALRGGVRFARAGLRDRVALASASDGGTFVAGTSSDGIDLGAGPIGAPSAGRAWAAKLDRTGAVLWRTTFGEPDARFGQGATAVAAREGGGAWVGGDFGGTLQAGSTRLVSAGRVDAFVAGLDERGVARWAARLGDACDQRISHLAAVPGDSVLVGGPFAGSLEVARASRLRAPRWRDAFVAHLSADGRANWARQLGAGALLVGLGADGDGTPVVAGLSGGASAGADGPLNAAGATTGNLFVGRLAR